MGFNLAKFLKVKSNNLIKNSKNKFKFIEYLTDFIEFMDNTSLPRPCESILARACSNNIHTYIHIYIHTPVIIIKVNGSIKVCHF